MTLAQTGTETELSVVVPTYNESKNIPEMVRRLNETLKDISWELIFVDDSSPDGSADVVRSIAREDHRIRLISRHNRRGLASAVVEGALAASADVVAVMDGDLQHDESVLPDMYYKVRDGEADVVSASRFLREDGADGLSSATRVAISNNGIKLSNFVFNLKMTDPLTGFFVVRRDVVRRALPELSELGFKVLMDVIVSAKPRPRVLEVPFKFRERQHGESKLDNKVMYEFFLFFICHVEKLQLPNLCLLLFLLLCVLFRLLGVVFCALKRLHSSNLTSSFCDPLYVRLARRSLVIRSGLFLKILFELF